MLFKDKNIMIAEDDLISREALTIFLKKNGFGVYPVDNGKQAISTFEKVKIDFILIAINMPSLDGYEVTSLIRLMEKESSRHTPIIAMTSYALNDDKRKFKAAGLDDFLVKPIDLEQVLKLIHECFQSQEIDLNNENANPKVSEIVNSIMKASGLDEGTCEMIVNEFLKQTEKILEEIKEYIYKKQYKEIELLLHRLKGSAGNVRANEISALAKEAEDAVKKLDLEKLSLIVENIEGLFKELVKK